MLRKPGEAGLIVWEEVGTNMDIDRRGYHVSLRVASRLSSNLARVKGRHHLLRAYIVWWKEVIA